MSATSAAKEEGVSASDISSLVPIIESSITDVSIVNGSIIDGLCGFFPVPIHSALRMTSSKLLRAGLIFKA